MGVTSAVVAVASLAYSVYANDESKRLGEQARERANQQAEAEVAQRNRLTAEHTAAVVSEAERERALAISNQDAQNVRVNALAAEAASNEKAIAQNLSERSQQEAMITKQDAARETARIQDLQSQTQGRQIAALASGGASVDAGGTAKALLLDTSTRANKDVTALKEAATSKENLLQKQGAFALEQGATSSRNILETAAHNTSTYSENVKNAADTLVANAKISGSTEVAMANLQNLMTLGSAKQFSEQVDKLRSEANARMWGNLLGSSVWSPQNLTTMSSLLSSSSTPAGKVDSNNAATLLS
jgi:hypothetical protein